jgi:hypothetical protein
MMDLSNIRIAFYDASQLFSDMVGCNYVDYGKNKSRLIINIHSWAYGAYKLYLYKLEFGSSWITGDRPVDGKNVPNLQYPIASTSLLLSLSLSLFVAQTCT